MAILDANLVFSKDQAITATANSNGQINLGVRGDAVGQELTLRVIVTETFATLTSLAIALQTTENNNWVDFLLTPAIPVAKLKKGAEIFCVRIPHGLSESVRLKYTVTGSNATAGKVTAYMSKEL